MWPVSAANAPSLSNKSYTHTHSPPTLSLPATPTPSLLPQQGLDRPLRAAFQLGQGGREVALQVGVRFFGGQRREDGLRRWGEGWEGACEGRVALTQTGTVGRGVPPSRTRGRRLGSSGQVWGAGGVGKRNSISLTSSGAPSGTTARAGASTTRSGALAASTTVAAPGARAAPSA